MVTALYQKGEVQHLEGAGGALTDVYARLQMVQVYTLACFTVCVDRCTSSEVASVYALGDNCGT